MKTLNLDPATAEYSFTLTGEGWKALVVISGKRTTSYTYADVRDMNPYAIPNEDKEKIFALGVGESFVDDCGDTWRREA